MAMNLERVLKMINDMNSSPLDDELTPLFPEVTIHHVASNSEVERLIQNTDENCTVIVIDTEQTFTKTQTNSEIHDHENQIVGDSDSSEAELDASNSSNKITESNDLDPEETNNGIDNDSNAQETERLNSVENKSNDKEPEGSNGESDYESNDRETEGPKRGRKRSRNQTDWKQNVRKRLRQSGKSYVDYKGRNKSAKKVQADCIGLCKFKCTTKISSSDRKKIFESYWSLNDPEKGCFYASTIDKEEKQRKRTTKINSRREFSFKYHFKISTSKIRVCKQFYLSTLDISAQRIQWFFSSNKKSLNDMRGRHVKKTIPEDAKNVIRNHIQSFQTMPSHYCRASTNRKYLEPGLSITKMYNMYKEHCASNDILPQKRHLYSSIFNYEFNLGFHVPRKDMCDLCEEHKAQSSNSMVSDELEVKYNDHIEGKNATKVERDNDRKGAIPVLCFDMQNVLSCPRANVSNFYYRRKLNVFNLTAHLSTTKKAYNAIWSEDIAGRGGNEIASALSAILKEVTNEHPNFTQIILWSDSCVPQNRNSIMTFALKYFLDKSTTLQQIEQKFCQPGHSSIQEVDNIHSHIEKAMSLSEIFSPVSLIRVLTNVRKGSMRIIQLRPQHFYKLSSYSTSLNFATVPYTKLKHIVLCKEKPLHVSYRISFLSELQETSIRMPTRTFASNIYQFPKVAIERSVPVMSKQKLDDLTQMMKYMPLVDKQF